jgi:hypothetical protein
MTVEYAFIEKLKLVIVNIADTVTFEQMVTHLMALSKDPRYQPPMKKLVDFRKCRKYDLTRDQAEKFATLNRELSNIFINEKCAIIAPGDLEFGMSRAHEMYTFGSGLDIQVFRQLPEGLDWLGIESRKFD